MSAPEDNPADDEPIDREAYEEWHAKEQAKEQRADEADVQHCLNCGEEFHRRDFPQTDAEATLCPECLP